MATMNISLPDQMKSWVEQQSDSGKYSNSSDYVRDLIRRDRIKAEKLAHMQALLNEARNSPTIKITTDELRARAGQIVQDAKA